MVKTFFNTRLIELIGRKELITAGFDPNNQIFVFYIIFFCKLQPKFRSLFFLTNSNSLFKD